MVIAATGAGSQAVAWLLGVAGSSRTVLEARVPYGRLAMIDFLGHERDQFVSPETARHMARVAYQRALLLREEIPLGRPLPKGETSTLPFTGDYQRAVIGLGCTAAIATDRPRRGEHRACLAVWDEDGAASYDLHLDKGQRQRSEEEELVSRLIINAVAKTCGIAGELPLGLRETDCLDAHYEKHPGPVQRLLSGDARLAIVYPDGHMVADDPLASTLGKKESSKGLAILPGSFRPLHRGHEQLAQVAAKILDAEVVFEISVVNVDKPPLALEEVLQRLPQFQDKHSVALTRAETFHKKANLFPGCTFVIGWDTAVRLFEPRYYDNDEKTMLTAMAQIWALGCRFLVAGRQQDGEFRTLADASIPQGFLPLLQEIPESVFRADISSTALRRQMGIG